MNSSHRDSTGAQAGAPRADLTDTKLAVWFERDRGHVALYWAGDGPNDPRGPIVEWWDSAVNEAIRDGFLDPRDYHRSAYAYAVHVGLLLEP